MNSREYIDAVSTGFVFFLCCAVMGAFFIEACT
jgi:hypothetical protein